jgi:D-beta-D-heptose 7-phosphate kinase/D-beta-D-heptose 1-phosphate adenosyltransferase
MALMERRGRLHLIPTVAREVYDVTGAGDTVIAVMALAHAAGASFLDSARLANSAAGSVVGHVGTAAPSLAELASFCTS